MTSIKDLVLFGIIVGLIGTPLSYLAMRIERKIVDLPIHSWIRIFITFVISGALALYIKNIL